MNGKRHRSARRRLGPEPGEEGSRIQAQEQKASGFSRRTPPNEFDENCPTSRVQAQARTWRLRTTPPILFTNSRDCHHSSRFTFFCTVREQPVRMAVGT